MIPEWMNMEILVTDRERRFADDLRAQARELERLRRERDRLKDLLAFDFFLLMALAGATTWLGLERLVG